MAIKKKSAIAPPHSAKHEKMLQVLAQFRVVFKSVRRHYKQVEQKTSISGAQLWALAQIADSPACTVGDLARELAIHQSTASNLLNRLDELGLMVRRREGNDQRVVTLHLTAEGRKALKSAPRPLIGVLQQGLMELSERDLASMGRLLDSLLGSMDVKDKSAGSTPLSDI